jgi:DNA recombination protein Rad52
MFNNETVEKLTAKLDSAHVKKRTQAGRQVSYIEGWQAIAEANRIFGHSEWDRETVELAQLGKTEENDKGNKVVAYMAKVRIRVRAGDNVVVREGCGFGSGFAKSEGDAHESAIKEAETDAMKRALMTFGNPFGLALYDKEQKEVEKPGARRAENTTGAQKTEAARTNGTAEKAKSYAISTTKGWDHWDEVMHRAIDKAADIDTLTRLQMDNATNLKAYGEKFTACYDAIMKAFTQRMGDLSQGPTT